MQIEDIYVIYGKKPKSMVKELLEKSDIISEIPQGAMIGLKPNLVVSKGAETRCV